MRREARKIIRNVVKNERKAIPTGAVTGVQALQTKTSPTTWFVLGFFVFSVAFFSLVTGFPMPITH
jgi:hypothetical protein